MDANHGIKPIYLIGMPGSGKTTIGKKYARKLGRIFFDLDKLIVEQSQKTIPELFEEIGQDGFRALESKVLKSIDETNAVISCGGGTPCFFDNLDFMLERGEVVWINTHISACWGRVRNGKNRPLVNSNAIAFFKLYDERKPFYERAHRKWFET